MTRPSMARQEYLTKATDVISKAQKNAETVLSYGDKVEKRHTMF